MRRERQANPPMTLKVNSKKVLDIVAGQETRNASQAYQQVYPRASAVTARNNAHQLLKKPEAQIYLQQHVDKARARVVELVGTDKEDIALRASQDILDRVYGKAKQSMDIVTTGITFNIDLTSQLSTDTEQIDEPTPAT